MFNEHLSKRSFYYTRLLLLLLLLAGDVERNPGPVDSMEDKQKINCISTVMDCSDRDKELKETSDLSLKNSWAAYGPGNSNHLEIFLTDSNNHCKKCMFLCSGIVICVCVPLCVCVCVCVCVKF